MRIRYSILAILCAGVCAFSQQQPAPSSTNEAQPQAKSDQKKQSPREANPFPEEQSQKAADAANGSAARKPGESSSHVDLKRFDAPAGSAERISNGEGGYVHDPQLGAKDVRIGNFYLQTRNYKGAYDRYMEATRVAPENGEAVFGLAEAARGLRRTQEAVTNYTVYLQAFPDGKKAKDAQKALKELNSAKK